MLDHCFLHIPGVGPSFCAKLRQAGICTWHDALTLPLPCGAAKEKEIKARVAASQERLAAGDARWFSSRLKPAEQWRLFPHFAHSAAYVDIETTGLMQDDCITSIALYDGNRVRTYVQGQNLEDFADDILDYSLLITWNGRSFDAPIIRRSLAIALDDPVSGHMAHLDLLPVFRALDLRGGLKKVEHTLGISRKELDGVDGYTAVLLWRYLERFGDPRALETLLAYNVADVLSLEALAVYAVERHAGRTPGPLRVKDHINPFSPHRDILRRLGYS